MAAGTGTPAAIALVAFGGRFAHTPSHTQPAGPICQRVQSAGSLQGLQCNLPAACHIFVLWPHAADRPKLYIREVM